MQALCQSCLLVLLDCLATLTVLLLKDVLLLMDADWLDIGHKYTDLHKEFEGLNITDVVDLNSLPVKIIASFGWLRQDSAHHLLRYCQDKFLIPLGFVEESSNDNNNNNNVTENDSTLIGQGQSINNELALEWLDNVGTYEEINDVTPRLALSCDVRSSLSSS